MLLSLENYSEKKGVEITEIFTLKQFWQKIRESNVFIKEITKELIWRNIFSLFEEMNSKTIVKNTSN